MKKLPFLLAACVLANTVAAQSLMPYRFTEAEQRESDELAQDDAAQYAKTGSSRFTFLRQARNVTASEMRDVYAANQIDGEQRFKGKYVRVEGTIIGFHSGVGDESSLTVGDLRSSFGSPVAKFPKGKSSALANLRKGQRVAVFCDVSGVYVGTPVMRDCRMQAEVREEALTTLKSRLGGFLEGRVADAEAAQDFFMIRFLSWPIGAVGLCAKKAVQRCVYSESLLDGRNRPAKTNDARLEELKGKVYADARVSTYRIVDRLYGSKFAGAVFPEISSDEKLSLERKDLQY